MSSGAHGWIGTAITAQRLVVTARAEVTLLQAGAAAGQARSVRVLIAAGLLIIVVIALGLIVLHMRRVLFRAEAEEGGPGLLLDDLRAMKQRGEISELEFDRMKQKLASQLSAALSRPKATRDVQSTRPSSAPGPAKAGEPPAPRQSPPSAIPDTSGPEKRARPGYDLTGEKLPEPGEGG